MFHVTDGLYFRRNNNGSVTIIKTSDGKEPCFPTPPDFPPEFGRVEGNIAFTHTLDDGSWCSVVLSMSAFSERPGDWHAWMSHHKGKEDCLSGSTPEQTAKQEEVKLPEIPEKVRSLPWDQYWRDVVLPVREGQLKSALQSLAEKESELAVARKALRDLCDSLRRREGSKLITVNHDELMVLIPAARAALESRKEQTND